MGREISLLPHSDLRTAAEIQSVMFAGYSIEAEILGVADFFPLHRTAERIAASPTSFFGLEIEGVLVAVAEVDDHSPAESNVDALVVHPDHFREGHATALLEHVIAARAGCDLTVSTGILNRPALLLYERHAFREARRWSTPDGIPMITLRRETSR